MFVPPRLVHVWTCLRAFTAGVEQHAMYALSAGVCWNVSLTLAGAELVVSSGGLDVVMAGLQAFGTVAEVAHPCVGVLW